MLSPQALIRGLVQRTLPSWLNPDGVNNDVAFRQGSYGEMYTLPLVRKHHNLCDEGSYFVANTAQTGYTRPIGTSYPATTAPWVIIQNQMPTQRMYLDYIAITALTATTAASAALYTAFSVVVDNGLRWASNGTLMTPVNPNMLLPSLPGGGVSLYAPSSSAMTASAASAAARTICGMRILRPAASGTALSVVGDMTLLNFGSVEGAVGVAAATGVTMPQALPPVIIGPLQSALIYTWLSATTPAAGTDVFEVGFWVR